MKITWPYTAASSIDTLLQEKMQQDIILVDHLSGFDEHGRSPVLDLLDRKAHRAKQILRIKWHNVLDQSVTQHYNNLKIEFDPALQEDLNFASLKDYNIHPDVDFKNFVCCFNGSKIHSRILLTGCLEKLSYWNSDYCSKNFSYNVDELDGTIEDYVGHQQQFYSKFFSNSHTFAESIYSFDFDRFNHRKNIDILAPKLTQSFVNIASESLADKYYPFVSEKFLYSVVTRGLFLAWAQPGWHKHLETYYGFKPYAKLFDYSFDLIENPVKRLIALMSMISKFSKLTVGDWQDLYSMESETIEYNYNHYFSNDYYRVMQQHSSKGSD